MSLKMTKCIIEGHYFVFDSNQDTDPKKPYGYYQDKYFAKCQRCGHRILVTDRGVGL